MLHEVSGEIFFFFSNCVVPENIHTPVFNWYVDFVFPNFNLALFSWERSWCRNCNLTEEENSSQCLKILTQITTEDENELAGIREVFPKKLTSESFDNYNKLTLKSFFAFCSVFFYEDQRRKDGNAYFETDTVSGFQNTPELKRAKTYSALRDLSEISRGEGSWKMGR